MKHAYLIITHNQFLALKELVAALDDSRNDIYIHFDKKVKSLPDIKTQHSQLFILDERVKVIWGDVSQIKTEFALFRAAFTPGKYSYYHLISGTHFPLKSNDDLHRWFDACDGACVLRQEPIPKGEVEFRCGRYHYFLKHLISKNKTINRLYHIGWKGVLSLQKKLGIKRDTSFVRGKSSNWCSLNEEAVRALLLNEAITLNRFSRSFCCDEYLVLSIIEDLGIDIVFDDRLVYAEFVRTTPRAFKEADFPRLMSSDSLFFRKLTDSNLNLAKAIEQAFIR